jgi:RNA polymerase sigma-70 factor (ECF subfamily)
VDNAELARLAKAGDAAAFDALLKPLMDWGYRLAYGMLLDRADAEDALQEACLIAWRKLGNVREGADPRPWFLAIVANQCRRTHRSPWKRILELAEHAVGVDARDEQIDLRTDVRQALTKLDESQRLVVLLRFYLDMPVDEVARVMGVAEGTVKSRLHRAAGRLRLELQPG